MYSRCFSGTAFWTGWTSCSSGGSLYRSPPVISRSLQIKHTQLYTIFNKKSRPTKKYWTLSVVKSNVDFFLCVVILKNKTRDGSTIFITNYWSRHTCKRQALEDSCQKFVFYPLSKVDGEESSGFKSRNPTTPPGNQTKNLNFSCLKITPLPPPFPRNLSFSQRVLNLGYQKSPPTLSTSEF